jgi:hypothetical protein
MIYATGQYATTWAIEREIPPSIYGTDAKPVWIARVGKVAIAAVQRITRRKG